MNKPLVLIIDDEPDIRELLEITLGRMNLTSVSAADVAQAKRLLSQHPIELCLTDMQLPDGDGLEIVEYINQQYTHIPVAVITAFGNMETAVNSLKAGAFDFVSKPIDLGRLRDLVNSALKVNDQQKNAMHPALIGTEQMIGQSESMVQLKQKIHKLARSQAPIFIQGDSGTGKELVARLIHNLGPRKSAPFIAVNCGAIPSELMESEFFGHKKGAFTGAHENKRGFFQSAHGGTLFLDEVADLPLAMQVKLLRVIQEKTVRPIGEQQEQAIDVRILSATHKDLLSLVNQAQFRQDLYYRINVIDVAVPALKNRGNDIHLLIECCLDKLSATYQQQKANLTQEAKHQLLHYHYPGNVRELENILERAFNLCDNHIIKSADLNLPNQQDFKDDDKIEQTEANEKAATPSITSSPSQNNEQHNKQKIAQQKPNKAVNSNVFASNNEHQLAEGESLEAYLANIEKVLITHALEECRWNKTAAAKQLGLSFRALRYKITKLDID